MRDWIGEHAAEVGVGALVFFWIVGVVWFGADLRQWWKRRR